MQGKTWAPQGSPGRLRYALQMSFIISSSLFAPKVVLHIPNAQLLQRHHIFPSMALPMWALQRGSLPVTFALALTGQVGRAWNKAYRYL